MLQDGKFRGVVVFRQRCVQSLGNLLYVGPHYPATVRLIELEIFKWSLFRKDGYYPGAVTIWAGLVFIICAEYPSMCTTKARLGEDRRWKGRQLNHRPYRKLPQKLFCDLYARYPCTVIAPINKETKDCHLSGGNGCCGFSERKPVFIT